MTSKRVPREEIPWHPTVKPETCTGCRACLEFCQHAVFAWDEARHIAVVRQPFNCLVGCSGCEPKCPSGAISFPDVEEIAALIRKLREES
jgi:NAD-dependent dihydropyrimidine dehydrogenase PreA subunit